VKPILQPTDRRPALREALRERWRRRQKRPYKRAHRNWVKLCDGEPAQVEKVTD